MSAAATLKALSTIRIIPVVVIDDVNRAADLAAALLEGGIPCAEITLRTPAGIDAIGAIGHMPGFVTGAGTVFTVEDVDKCVDAGARFLVSPGFDEQVVARAQLHDIAIIPGAASATEIQRAMRAGVRVVKFFPADRLGGLGTIAALSAPFSGVKFLPSGGVTPSNAPEYLRHPAIFGVSGSWMVPRDLIGRGDFKTIESVTQTAASMVAAAS